MESVDVALTLCYGAVVFYGAVVLHKNEGQGSIANPFVRQEFGQDRLPLAAAPLRVRCLSSLLGQSGFSLNALPLLVRTRTKKNPKPTLSIYSYSVYLFILCLFIHIDRRRPRRRPSLLY
jgi:hypothetical protein